VKPAEAGPLRDRLDTLALIRAALMLILLVGLVGTEVELLLLEHTDGVWQIVPLVLLGLGIVMAVWCIAKKSAASIRGLRATMILFIVSGLLGVVLHFKGNVAYEHDSDPSLSGRALYVSAVSGSTPTLAPGTMIQLGLVGLVFTFRYSGRRRPPAPDEHQRTEL
jgi:hypothetical protein